MWKRRSHPKDTTVHNHLDARRYKGCKCHRFESCPDCYFIINNLNYKAMDEDEIPMEVGITDIDTGIL